MVFVARALGLNVVIAQQKYMRIAMATALGVHCRPYVLFPLPMWLFSQATACVA